ncbi:MAG: hypothetical protein FJ009_07500, partial [Chloroflexi bacterium]|nr:hypothetical protein [Chloroflexota bacterium]
AFLREDRLWHKQSTPVPPGVQFASLNTCQSFLLQGNQCAKYFDCARRAYDGIIAEFVRVDDAGQVHLTNTCQSAGLGGTPYRDGSYEYYIGEPRVTDNHHGVGAFILASAEIESIGD